MRLWLVVLLGIASAGNVFGQDSPFLQGTGRPIIRPDGTYVFNHAPSSDLVFEAQLAPRIIILDSIGKATRTVLDHPGGAWGWTLATSPMVRLRMFHEFSNPVRTPSYMPKAILQLAHMKNVSRSEDEDERLKGPVAMWLVDTIPFGHHSNGQDGSLFTPTGSINKTDGSFSTNYVEAMIAYGRMHLIARDDVQEYGTRWEWRAGVDVQLNPRGFLGGGIDDELAAIYGRTRIGLEGMAARRDGWRCGRLEGQLRMQYIHDKPAGVPPVTIVAEGSCLPAKWGGAGVFVRFYRGQDYYNLGFAESITRVQFGITLQQATFLSFRIPPL